MELVEEVGLAILVKEPVVLYCVKVQGLRDIVCDEDSDYSF